MILALSEEEIKETGQSKGAAGHCGCAKMAALVSSSGVPPIYHAYPPPLATYEEVVANPKLFMDTLEKLHITMKTKFMIPIIGGRDLDLHRLFVEVTSRGGIEKILREKRWKEVTAVFNFPSTATNASFILRKYYYQLLNHYEQIYFFKAKGWSPLPPGSIQTGAHSFPIVVHGVVKPALPPPSVLQATHQHQHHHHQQGFEAADHSGAASLQASSISGASLSGTPVIGVIDGKFEGGYLVTVTVGSEKLKGVLYQSLAPATATATVMVQNPAGPGLGLGLAGAKRLGEDAAPMAAGPPAVKRRRRRKKSEIRRRDPNHPKPNRSGYNFFFKEEHARLKPQYPGRDREISRMIGELWTNLNETDRAVYQEKARKDKERYRIEMEGYRERLKSGELAAAAVSSNSIPLRQRVPPEHLGAQMVDVVVKEGSVLSNMTTTNRTPTPTGAADDQTYEEEDEDEEEDDEEEDEDEYDDDDYEGSSMSGGVGSGSGDQVGEVQEEVGHIDRGSKMNNTINPSAEDQKADHQKQKQEVGSTMIPSSTTTTSSISVLSVEAAGKRPAAAEESTRLG